MNSLKPGIAGGTYPEREDSRAGGLARTLRALRMGCRAKREWKRGFPGSLSAIQRHSQKFAGCTDAELREATVTLRKQLYIRGLIDELIEEGFALVREAAGRTLGMRHYDNQLKAGLVLIRGGLAELETGEGKTLTATLGAATAALAGIPVHVITVNDYLAARDAELMRPVYEFLGLTVAAATSKLEPSKRRAAYAQDIAYCTNKQLAFDYLRDLILLGRDHGRLRSRIERLHKKNPKSEQLFLRGLCFAIIDEADSVLIDEARTPLIISKQSTADTETDIYMAAMAFADDLEPGVDFVIARRDGTIDLTAAAAEKVEEAAQNLTGVWKSTRQREELIVKALTAKYLYERDHHYLVEEDKVLIIDENTGRVMADRSWEHGLHQMIEIKEGCSVTGRREHMARLTYQRFFRRYLQLAGMTGTAWEVRKELCSVYGLPVLRIPTHKPGRRRHLASKVFTCKEMKFAAIVSRTREMSEKKRPVLIGTRTVADSEQISQMLDDAGLVNQVLNARQNREEADVVARAGEAGCITVATNMAGRGTDIPLAAGVAELGGLHIIGVEYNDAKRIDRQLFGRCGRQGDPGSCEAFVCLEDELLQSYVQPFSLQLLAKGLNPQRGAGRILLLLLMRMAQATQEKHHRRLRRDLLQMEEQVDKLLAFGGGME